MGSHHKSGGSFSRISIKDQKKKGLHLKSKKFLRNFMSKKEDFFVEIPLPSA